MPMKAALIAGVVVVAMAAGGFFFMKSPVTAAGPNAGADTVSAQTDNPTFVTLPRMMLPVVDGQRTVQFVELDLMVELANDEAAEEFQANIKRVQDRLISDLHGRFDVTTGEQGGMVDALRVKRKVAAAVAAIIGRDAVEDVLIQNIRQRRI